MSKFVPPNRAATKEKKLIRQIKHDSAFSHSIHIPSRGSYHKTFQQNLLIHQLQQNFSAPNVVFARLGRWVVDKLAQILTFLQNKKVLLYFF